MDRRTFIAAGTAALIATQARAEASVAQPQFSTKNARWQAAYDKALKVLAGNVQMMPRYSKEVLIEGAVYQGIWMECGPHEALVYRKFRPDVARQSHLTFFEQQRLDGQIPCNSKVTETGFGQIQMVVPIAATAWELAQATGDDELLHTAYRGGGLWDDWLMRYRNTRGTGLVEGFCTYDTGHDNSPRWKDIPPQCPNKDAKRFPPIPTLPRLCPDLSATTFGARVALSEMAKALGKESEAAQWAEKAENLRQLILKTLYSGEDAAFYDLDNQGQFVRVNCDILSRVCGEHVPDQALFDTLWTKQIHNPQKFWAEFPLPSVALDDPQFVRPIPANSWGGPSQALTALRAGRWFDHYGRGAEFSHMMNQWCEGLQRDMTFRQQMDPLNAHFNQEEAPDYSPAALVMLDYTWRLAGICEARDSLDWNIRPGHAVADGASFSLPTDAGLTAAMTYDPKGADLKLRDKPLGRIEGVARLVTGKTGTPQALVGISEKPEKITLRLAGRPGRHLTLKPNERIAL